MGFTVEMADGRPPQRAELVEALDAASRSAGLPDARRLTVFTGDLGIARCSHQELDAMVKALASIVEVGGRRAIVRTTVTSGTIKKVKGHLGLGREG